MSRSGYTDEGGDDWAMIRWRGAVASGIRGHRGQRLLRELLQALDEMPEKRLIANSFAADGGYCTLGVIGAKRGAKMPNAGDYEEYEGHELSRHAAAELDIAPAMAAEIMFLNDEGFWGCYNEEETPEGRWLRMRNWVAEQIQEVV